MSIARTCPNCYQKEGIRYNFGNDREAEKEFHSKNWCDCGYLSPNEMMLDQDMGFDDPKWIPIAKYFIKNYHDSISQGYIHNSEELLRFFLKLLQSSANNVRKSIVIVDRKEGEEYEYVFEGKAKKTPKSDIFKDFVIPELKFPYVLPNLNKGKNRLSSSNIIVWLSLGVIIGVGLGKLF